MRYYHLPTRLPTTNRFGAVKADPSGWGHLNSIDADGEPQRIAAALAEAPPKDKGGKCVR
jgi:hypothetical protein